jgi:hypothetical protein
MTDIVTRLRAYNPFSSPYMDEITHAAADEIERLRGALEKIAMHDMQAIALDALRPGERSSHETRPTPDQRPRCRLAAT